MAGETADLVILSASAIAALEKTGIFVPGSRTDLGRTVTGVVVREGAPAPDISTPEAFKQALLKAKTVAYSDPKAGGSSGTYFAGLLDKLGIADAGQQEGRAGQARLRGGAGRRRRPGRDRHHLHQRGA